MPVVKRLVITLLTDFGLADAYAGVMKGVILGIAPDVRLVDLCHEVPPQDVRAGAFLLMTSYPFFPAGTIHLAVVDPGVGTDRKIVAVRAGDHCFVGPDNGLLRWAADRADPDGSRRIVAVEHPAYRLSQVSTTFHGRDVMAPAAAHLAAGVALEVLGPPLAELAGDPFPHPVRQRNELVGQVVYVDRFGNCVTNLAAPGRAGVSARAGARPAAEVAGRCLPLVATYGGGEPGQALAVTGSSGFVEIAVRNGSAARDLGIGVDTPVALRD